MSACMHSLARPRYPHALRCEMPRRVRCASAWRRPDGVVRAEVSSPELSKSGVRVDQFPIVNRLVQVSAPGRGDSRIAGGIAGFIFDERHRLGGWTTTQDRTCGRFRLVAYAPYRNVSWSTHWQETHAVSLRSQLPAIVPAMRAWPLRAFPNVTPSTWPR